MHQALFIQEILLEIFGHSLLDKADLAALVRTCRTFKEPALDVLWEWLSDLSPLARCLPEACYRCGRWDYSFSRPLSEAEWDTLQGYTRRVWSIYHPLESFGKVTAKTLVPFTDPLFPNLRSLSWDHFTKLPVVHIAVPSLTSLYLTSWGLEDGIHPPTEFLDAVGERCPNVRRFVVDFFPSGPLDAAISRQLCRWTNLQRAHCPEVTLTMATILYLPSMSTLKQLSFKLSADLDNEVAHLGSALVFSSLASLEIKSASLKSITKLFSRIQLPKIKGLDVSVSKYTPRWEVREYWTAVQKACSSNTLAYLEFSSSGDGIENRTGLDEQRRPWLTLGDLLPYKDIGNLRKIAINIVWSVKLTDTDLLDLVSTSPQLEVLSINNFWGWRMYGEGGRITLGGLVQLLRQCPSLHRVSLVIDTRTFTKIPHGLDVSFPPRGTWQEPLSLYYLDSYIAPEFVPDLESVFTALGVHLWPPIGPQ